MHKTDTLYIAPPKRFTAKQDMWWRNLYHKNYKLFCFLYYYKIKKYPPRHTMKLIFVSKNTYYSMKKEADKIWNDYFQVDARAYNKV